MPAEGFIWALQVGYALFMYEWLRQLLPAVWDTLTTVLNGAVQALREAGFDV
jgi:hypothetical protein